MKQIIKNKTNNLNFDYATLEDNVITDEIKESIIEEKGFFLYPSELFINVTKRAHNDENLNETTKTIKAGICDNLPKFL